MTVTRRTGDEGDLDGLVALYQAYDVAEFGWPEMERADLQAMLTLEGSERRLLVLDGRVVGHAELAASGEVESAVDGELVDADELHVELLGWLRERAADRGISHGGSGLGTALGMSVTEEFRRWERPV